MAARTGNWIKRLELVEKAWKVLDKYNDGSVTMEDLMEVYDVSLHPDVFSGKITEEEAMVSATHIAVPRFDARNAPPPSGMDAQGLSSWHRMWEQISLDEMHGLIAC